MSLLKLQKMIDSCKTYCYRDQTAVIKSFESRPNGFEIVVEIYGKPQIFLKETEEKISLFLENFEELPVVTEAEEIHNLPATNKPNTVYVPEIYTETKSLFKSLSDKLLEDIDKVRDKPEYVNQAKQVCNNVSAIVNITKLQLQLLQNG
jgi:hypothetical protein